MTRNDHASGSDRIFEALAPSTRTRGRALSSTSRRPADACASDLKPRSARSPIPRRHATIAAEFREDAERANRTCEGRGSGFARPPARALFHPPTAPYGEGPLYHHIGLYAYRRERSPASFRCPSPLENARS